MNKRGVALIITLMVILVLAVLSAAIISQSVSESNYVKKYAQVQQAFWLAEAGVNKAIKELGIDYNMSSFDSYTDPTNNITYHYLNATNVTSLLSLGSYTGGYNFTVFHNSSDDLNRTISASGFVPFASPHLTRTIEVVLRRVPDAPDNFYDNVIYVAGDLEFNVHGNFNVSGNVTYAGNLTQSGGSGDFDPEPVHDTSIHPLFEMNFEQLETISKAQGNYHNSSNLSGPFPGSFWYNESTSTPNVIYMEGDLQIQSVRGKDKDIGGFFVTKGKVTYNETNETEGEDYNASLGGNVNLHGVIYTPGDFQGGGSGAGEGSGNLYVDGGIFVGNFTKIGGTPDFTYNATYMNAIRNNTPATTELNISFWKDEQNRGY